MSTLIPPKKQISDELIQFAKKASTATISGALSKRGFRFLYMAGVLPIRAGTVMAGRAYTLRYLPRREDHNSENDRAAYAEHVAIESVGPGEVLVIDARGNTGAGVFGDRLVARMVFRGAEGMVTDGAMRDIPYLRGQEFPVFIKAPHGYGHTVEHWAMDHQLPISCGNVLIYPGDLIVGDDDGVVVCPQAIAEEVIIESVAQEEEEEFTRELIEEGANIVDVHGKLLGETLERYTKWREAKGLPPAIDKPY